MLEVHGPWAYEAGCIDEARAEVSQIVDHMTANAPAGNRSRGLLAYLKAAERCLDGARLFAEGKDLACQEADEAQDHLCDHVLDKSPASEDAAGLLNEVFASVGETDIEEDSAEQRKLTVEEYRFARAVTSLVVLQHPDAAQGLQSVRPTGMTTGHGRRCIKVAIRDRSGVVVDCIWWTEPGMDAAKVAEAIGQMIRAELDPSVPWPEVKSRPFKYEVSDVDVDGNPIDTESPEYVAERERVRKQNEEFSDSLRRDRAEARENMRRVYDERPASEIPPIPLPEDSAWEPRPGRGGYRICGELSTESHLDECRTWSAVLERKAFVCDAPSSSGVGGKMQIHALFLSHVVGARTEEMAKDAVVEAARIAGWLSRP